MSKAKVVRFFKTGGPEVLELIEEDIAGLGPNEIRIRVEAIGLNRAEALFRSGTYLEAPVLPARLGYEAAGVVDAVGDAVTDFAPGDRVSTIPAFSLNEYGVYGEIATVPAHAVTKHPDSLSSQQAAATWMQYLTAYGALIDICGLKAGQTALITAASSSVGLAAIQIATRQGARVIATTRTVEKRDFLLANGAEEVIVTNDEDLAKRVLTITDQIGADVIFDPVSGPQVEILASIAAQGGQIIIYGGLDPAPTPFPLFSALGKGLTLRGYVVFEITQQPTRLAPAIEYIAKGLADGGLVPIIDEVFHISDIRAAHAYLERNKQRGKIVVEV
ncbi:MAG: zinc-dependent alcohol dehydrogenase family protein [Pseudomonadota bacterium]